MVTQQLRKVGNSYVITIPKAEVERLGAKEGDFIASDHTLLEMKPVLSAEMQAYADRNREALTELMHYLKDK
ncbi:MAG: hypothetical protein M9953_09590 [Thermomicrobiales bacterium]|nr:hypothetical protein [Thermomicrobiales bacterium]MCO5225579.1 hypothetical protein [Thermomicrobiales bacterium]MCO5227217.1 hypothetical protein [Thermomicrobiales bacterium]